MTECLELKVGSDTQLIHENRKVSVSIKKYLDDPCVICVHECL